MMKGWDFNYKDGHITADPVPDVLGEKIREATTQLARKISDEEMKLVLMGIPEHSLMELLEQVHREIERREVARLRAEGKL